MNRCILYCASIFFMLFVLEGKLGVKITRSKSSHFTPSLFTNWSTGKTNESMVERPTLPKREVYKLRGLRSDLAALLATYVSRETFKTTPSKYANWITNKMKRRASNVSYPHRRTKITSKMYYKLKRTYPTPKERRYMMYRHFVAIFSKKDKQKEVFLTDSKTRPEKANSCYFQVHSSFTRYCFVERELYWKFAGLREMQELLARACAAEWLTTNNIMYAIQTCCNKKFRFKPLTFRPNHAKSERMCTSTTGEPRKDRSSRVGEHFR